MSWHVMALAVTAATVIAMRFSLATLGGRLMGFEKIRGCS